MFSELIHDPHAWVALAFVIFCILLGPKIWAAVAKALDARADGIRANLDEATRLRREAEQMLEDATREREKAKDDAAHLIEASKADAEALRASAAKEAAQATKLHEQMAQDRIQAAEQAALKEIRDQAMKIAFEATRGLVAEQLSSQPALRDQLIEHSLGNLKSALQDNNQANRDAANGTTAADQHAA
ncbi:F0F1 ATP synthase subunit B [Formicincola oecophyllae]|uniref:ATP synthase subunit b n=1 Tax=Formicincola oecophyllae TaxID=2558361 RepID=A0A4Y6U817_9PROT|nr:F0F1 ATP synthase subunit B [Formicincola oecophyllae]QDH13492.1 F0F1 ATP synthase subunit B [Formicincola oecophyllae]